MRGLRANWGMGEALHDFMANLVFRDEEDEYRPTGEWYLYEYYAFMEGERVVSSASEDGLFDAFGVVGGEGARILAGTASVCGRYEISVGGLCALGLPEEGEVAVRTLRFDYEGTDVDTGGPVNLGTENVAYSGDTVSSALFCFIPALQFFSWLGYVIWPLTERCSLRCITTLRTTIRASPTRSWLPKRNKCQDGGHSKVRLLRRHCI